MFSIQTAVTIVTAGIANSITGGIISTELWTVFITIFCSLVLIIGKYNTLDKIIKYIIIILAISTITATLMAGFEFESTISFEQIFPKDSVGIIFLIAFMGWMPAPLDVSVWHSILALEKKKTLKDYSLENSMFDLLIDMKKRLRYVNSGRLLADHILQHIGSERSDPIREMHFLMFFCFFAFSNLRRVRGFWPSLGGPNYARCCCVK